MLSGRGRRSEIFSNPVVILIVRPRDPQCQLAGGVGVRAARRGGGGRHPVASNSSFSQNFCIWLQLCCEIFRCPPSKLSPLCPGDQTTLTQGRLGGWGKSSGLVTQSRMLLQRQPAKGLNLGARRWPACPPSDDL